MKSKSYKIITLLALLLLISCSREQITSPEYEIYSEILSSFKAKYLVVSNRTSDFMLQDLDYESLLKRFPTLEKETFEDLRTKMKKIDTLDYHFISNKIIILKRPEETLKEAFESQKENIRKDYSKLKIQGTTVFSRVGFNSSMTQAIVIDWTQQFPLGGSGYISLFEHNNKHWKLIASSLYGIS
jgi:hypothetical protein